MIQFFAQYLDKNRFRPMIPDLPEHAPRMIVAMPCYKEPDPVRSLESLYRCRRPGCFTEVIAVINHPENASDEAKRQNEASLRNMRLWMATHGDEKLRFHAVYAPDIPEKVAGVGTARKIGMDEAVYRFMRSGVVDGVIIGFDADSVCDDNYLEELERAFFGGRSINGASVYFEHPTEGAEYPAAIYERVTLYELHLRYLNQALRYAGFPYAYHTVGSAFAVRAAAYAKQGGMNRRKAGEDFHFLQKIIPSGNYAEINTTRIVPSPRESDRVPFGTGASIRRAMHDDAEALYTYPLEPFTDLKRLFALVPDFFKAAPEVIENIAATLSLPLRSYLERNDYVRHIVQAGANSASPDAFAKRFFAWFDGLQTVKYLNESCRGDYAKLPADEAGAVLLRAAGCKTAGSAKELLRIYRKTERRGDVLKFDIRK